MEETQITVMGHSYIGNRESQQDAYEICKNGKMIMAVVCDGMGGEESGELASNCAASVIKEDFEP